MEELIDPRKSNSPSNNLLQAALNYANSGFSVIPIKPDKKPFVKWEKYQKRRPTVDEISHWWDKWPRALIGIVTGQISGLFVVDCDTVDGYNSIEKLLPDSLEIPTARTPRGGWHFYFKYSEDSDFTTKAGIMPGVDIRGEGGYIIAAPSVNAEGKSYTWQISIADIAELPSLPHSLKSALINKSTLYRAGVDTFVDNATFYKAGTRNSDLFTVANALTRNKIQRSFIDHTIEILAKNCSPPYPRKEIESIISSARDRSDRKDRTLAADVREWILSTNGVFSSTEIYSCLQLSTREDRKNVSIILKRLSQEGLIEKYGNKNGQYRCLENEVAPFEWQNADVDPRDLIWPFAIHGLVSLYPGNVAVIAGSPNSGKTAFILNFIRLNQNKHKIHLFSSEGGKEELRQRISKFEYPLKSWNFRAWDRAGNFSDVIKPDDINIIDYMEIHDEFYKIGGIIKSISDRLKSGFALIAIQKNNGRDEGLGGTRGLEKPRLYLSMDAGRLKIVKAKSRVDESINPNGLSINFKLVQGCKFVPQSEWYKQ
jgi:hypothetical protein